MIRHLTSRIAGIALAAAAGAAVLLAAAPAAGARTATCSAGTSRQAHACEQSRRHHKRGHGGHSSHSRKHTRHKSAPSGIATHLAPVCEDGSGPTFSSAGATCVDGSEPQCGLSTTPVFTAAGTLLYCTPDTLPGEEECGTEDTPSCNDGTASGAAAPACEDGTEAGLNLEGVYACDDGSEPHCGEGFSLSISESGESLVCEPATEEET